MLGDHLLRDPCGWLGLRSSVQAELALDEEVDLVGVQLTFLLHDLAGNLEGEHQLVLLKQAQAHIAEGVPGQGLQNVPEPLYQLRGLQVKPQQDGHVVIQTAARLRSV